MKKKNIFYVGFGLILIILVVAGFVFRDDIKIKKNNNIIVTDLFEYVVKLPTYTDINYESGINAVNKKYDGWNNEKTDGEKLDGACTSSAKVMENGDMVLSRNMDLNLSYSPEYVFYVNTPGKYKSFNIAYLPKLGDYKDIVKNGLDKDIYDFVPYIVTDAMNEHGLVIEMNMRTEEYDLTTGELILGCSGTNPNGDLRISVLSLVRYLADNAKNVDEALKILGAVNYETKEKYGDSNLDIYSINTDDNKWNLAFQIADESGNFGVIEFVDNKVIFHPKAETQANYYLTKEYRDGELYAAGEARVDTILKDYDNINNILEMMANMTKVRYSNIYYPDKAKFDVNSEYIGTSMFYLFTLLENNKTKYGYNIPDYSKLYQTIYDFDSNKYVTVNYDNYKDYPNSMAAWTTDFVTDPAKRKEVDMFTKWYYEFYDALTDTQKRELGIFWITAHAATFNANEKYAIVTFFEDEEKTMTFSLDDID